jgi:CO/xanthine dehydrogenase Mo-binding subunit
MHRSRRGSVAASLRNYRIPTYADIPRTEVLLVETQDSVGPMGAKGIAESNVNPVAPALAACWWETCCPAPP